MNKSIIEEIYLDNEGFAEKIKPSEGYKKVFDESYGYYEELMQSLNNEQKKILDKYTEARIGICAEAELTHFKEGFKLGLLLAIECLNK